MRVLSVCNGSAGKRHAKIAEEFGYSVGTADKYAPADFENLHSALYRKSWDIAVICTPPQDHVIQAQVSIGEGLYVLCEKPLCGIGQLSLANQLLAEPYRNKFMIAYNYRFSDDFDRANKPPSSNWWIMKCQQYRDKIPSWGLLLDHVSHDLDIISWQTASDLIIEYASHEEKINSDTIHIMGSIKDTEHRFEITEHVDKMNSNTRRMAKLVTPYGWFDITGSSKMYYKMWESFIDSIKRGTTFWPGIQDALYTQELLEDVHKCLLPT